MKCTAKPINRRTEMVISVPGSFHDHGLGAWAPLIQNKATSSTGWPMSGQEKNTIHGQM